MKKIATLLLAAAMILTLALSASAYFEAEEAFGEVAFSIGKQTVAWNPDGTITDGEYYKVDIKPEWLSYAINDNDTDAGLAYAKATTPELWMSWDENYVYSATRYEVTEGHENLWDGDPASMWYSGAVQFNYANFDEVASEYRLEYGVGLSSDTGDILYTVWADGTGEGYQPTQDDAKVWLDGNTLTYETRCPWSAFADEDNTGYKEGNGFNTTFVWSIGKGQDYVHIQLAEGCTGNGKHAENMAQVTLAADAPVPYTPVGELDVPYCTPEVDGVIGDGEYPETGKVVLNQSNMTALGWLGEVPAENSIDLYCAWDNNNFYVAGDVTDPAFMYSDMGQYNGDAFQVSLNIGNVFKEEDGYDRAIFYSWGLQEEGTIDVIRQESANNDTIFEIGKGQVTDKGWCFEVALSLEMLADDAFQKGGEEAIPEPGMPIGGLFCYLDHDDVGSLVNAYGSCTDEVVGWGPDSHGITFMFAAKAEEEPVYAYPASGTDGSIINGTVIGNETGWGDNAAAGAAAAFDGDPATFFDPLGVGDGFCGIDAGESYILDKVAILSRDGFADRFDGAKIQGSNDGENWETLWTSDAQAASTTEYTIVTEFENNTGYSQFRYFNDKNHGDVAEVEFYGAPGKVEAASRGLADVNAAADGKNIITAYEFVSGTGSFGGEGPENLWDGETGTKFCTNEFPAESVVKLDGTYNITGFTMATANDNADYNGRSPNAWTISVSADGENWTELASGDDTFFEETNFTYYPGEGTADGVSYVKFSADGTASGTFQVSELTVFGDKAAAAADEKLDAKAEAPNTFDFGVVAAVAAVISLGGFAVSKKRH